MTPPWLSLHGGAVHVSIRLQPRASRTEIAGSGGDSLRIRVAAPPVDGAANDALVRFLASRTGMPRSAIRLVRGRASRQKIVAIEGLDPDALAACLDWRDTDP